MEFPGIGTLAYEPMDPELTPFLKRKYTAFFR